jgi:hypothetical protein
MENNEGNLDDKSLYPLPYKSTGHNLWQLFLQGNTLDHFRRFDRTDYIFCTDRVGLSDFSETRRADFIENSIRDSRPVLLLGFDVFKEFMPSVTFGGMPFRMGHLFCIGNPKRNNRNYENPEYMRMNANMAAKALCEALTLACRDPLAEAG